MPGPLARLQERSENWREAHPYIALSPETRRGPMHAGALAAGLCFRESYSPLQRMGMNQGSETAQRTR